MFKEGSRAGKVKTIILARFLARMKGSGRNRGLSLSLSREKQRSGGGQKEKTGEAALAGVWSPDLAGGEGSGGRR